jgi:hypothetical protein
MDQAAYRQWHVLLPCPHKHKGAAGADQLSRGPHRGVRTGALDHYVGSPPARACAHQRGGFIGMGHRRAHAQDEFSPAFGPVDRHDVGGTGGQRELGDQATDRARADDGDSTGRHAGRLAQRPDSHSGRLGERGHIKLHMRRYGHAGGAVGEHVGGQPTIGLQTEHGQRRAQVLLVPRAEPAGPAAAHHVGDDALTAGHRCAGGDHATHDLVAQGDTGAGELRRDLDRPGQVLLQIRAADADPFDRDEHLARAGYWYRPGFQPQVSGAVEAKCPHNEPGAAVLADQLRTSCARPGVDLNEGAAELILADRVNEVARPLRVTDQHAIPDVGALHEVGGKIYLGPPKTPDSVRDIHIPPFLIDLLRSVLDSHDEDRSSPANAAAYCAVPPSAAACGNPPSTGTRATVTNQSCAACNFHDLRHTHKTWLIEDDIPEVAQARRLGHRLPGVRGIYSHVTPAMNQRIVDALEGRWSATGRRTTVEDAPAA